MSKRRMESTAAPMRRVATTMTLAAAATTVQRQLTSRRPLQPPPPNHLALAKLDALSLFVHDVPLSLGVTCACVYTSIQSSQWTTPPSPSSAEPSALKTEDVSVLFALAFDVSAVICFAAAAAALLHPFAKL